MNTPATTYSSMKRKYSGGCCLGFNSIVSLGRDEFRSQRIQLAGLGCFRSVQVQIVQHGCCVIGSVINIFNCTLLYRIVLL